MATSPKLPDVPPGTVRADPNVTVPPRPVTDAPRAVTPTLLTYVSQTACCPATGPGPALIVGWSRPETVIDCGENVWPPSVLRPTTTAVPPAFSDEAYRLPNAS